MPLIRNGGLDELIKLPASGAEPIIDGLLYEGQTAFLTGAPGSGKSYFAIMLSILAAAGADWYGKFSAKTPRRVLYIPTEGSIYDIQERVLGPANELGWGELVGDRWQFWLPQYMDLSGTAESGRVAFEELKARASDTDLIIFDSFYSSFMGSASNDDTASRVAQKVSELKLSGNRANKAVMFIHHDSRDIRDSDGEVIDRDKPYLGSVIIEAMADQMWHYRGATVKTGAAKFRQIKGRSRFHQFDSFYVMLDEETGVLLPQDSAPTHQALKVESLFRQRTDPITNKELSMWAMSKGIGESTARRHRDTLVDECKIQQIERGSYQWAGASTSNLV